MKKSECIRHIIAEATARCAHKNVSDLRIAAEAATQLAETWWSIDWDPEEPELAQRIYVGTTLDGGERRGLWTHNAAMAPRHLTEAEEREAARRFNAYPMLEALARDMAKDLRNWERGHGGSPTTRKLLDSAYGLGLLPKEAPHDD